MPNSFWTEEQKIASASRCKQERPNQLYAEVSVYVDSFSDGRVTLRAKAKDSNTDAKGSPFVTPVALEWGKDERLWAGCPGDLPTTAEGLPISGTTGTLYLRSDLITCNNLGYRPKWPTEGGDERGRYATMKIYPLRVTLRGQELHSGREQAVEIELFNETQTDPTQEVVLKRGELAVRVSEDVFFKYGLSAPTLRQVRAAKEKIESPDSSAQELSEAWRIVSMFPRSRGGAIVDEQPGDESAQAQRLIDSIFEARAAKIL